MAIITPESMFTASEMTEAVNKLPAMKTFMASYFDNVSVRTTSVSFDTKEGQIILVGSSERGTQPSTVTADKRKGVLIPVVHLALEDYIKPEDIQDVRGFGTTEPMTAEKVINDKLQKLKNSINMTLEYHRLGAIKGKVLDADGTSVLYDLYDIFEKTKKTQAINFTASDRTCVKEINKVVRFVEAGMGGNPYSRIEAIVGDEFYDALTTSPAVADYFYDWLSRKDNFGENDYRHKGFTFGGITFFESTQAVGGKTLIDSDKAHVYPVGPGINKSFNAPADWMSTANTYGLPMYARMDMLDRDRGYVLEVQANPATICTFPEALVELSFK